MNIFVDFDTWGRMGNRMFQHAFAYLLATRRNCNLYSDGLPNFKIPPSFYSDTKCLNNPIFTRSFGDNNVDMYQLHTTQRDVIVNSFVQRSTYYTDYKSALCRLFSVNTNETTINTNKLVLHVRETDYVILNKFLGYDFYKKIIEQSGFKDVIIVTDNSECDVVKKLLKEGCVLNSEGKVETFNHASDSRGMEDFNTLLYSENIALSQSSFSWWAGFLGNHKTVIFPYTDNKGMWKIQPGIDDVDLFFENSCNKKIII
jgi:hypothetical protein